MSPPRLSGEVGRSMVRLRGGDVTLWGDPNLDPTLLPFPLLRHTDARY